VGSSGGLPMRRRLSIREEATVREVFDLFDEDDNGAISRDEVAIVIQSLLGGLLSFCYSYCYEF
jgi:Ca2+-binding EF-hand superfamily protein